MTNENLFWKQIQKISITHLPNNFSMDRGGARYTILFLGSKTPPTCVNGHGRVVRGPLSGTVHHGQTEHVHAWRQPGHRQYGRPHALHVHQRRQRGYLAKQHVKYTCSCALFGCLLVVRNPACVVNNTNQLKFQTSSLLCILET